MPVNKYELGPALKGAIMFIILATTFGSGVYVGKKGILGDLLDMEFEISKEDNEVGKRINENHDKEVENAKAEIKLRSYDNDCARLTVRELRLQQR